MVFLIIQDLKSNRIKRVNVVFTLKFARAENSDSSVGMMRLKEPINPQRTMNSILMTFQSRSAKFDPANVHKGC